MSLVGYVAVLELIDTRVYTNRHACIHKQQSIWTWMLNHQHGPCCMGIPFFERDRRCFTHAVRGSINVGVLVQYDTLWIEAHQRARLRGWSLTIHVIICSRSCCVCRKHYPTSGCTWCDCPSVLRTHATSTYNDHA